ncbi:MAG: hypothetical protein EOO59_18290, partial [Hymenobacter sp.]
MTDILKMQLLTSMQYYSLNHQSPPVDFRAATIAGQAPDGGLYFPASIPQFPAEFLQNLPNLSRAAIAYTVMQPYVGDTIPAADLRRICADMLGHGHQREFKIHRFGADAAQVGRRNRVAHVGLH